VSTGRREIQNRWLCPSPIDPLIDLIFRLGLQPPTQLRIKAVGKDAAFQIFAKRLADIGLWRMVVGLPAELARVGQFKPGLGLNAPELITLCTDSTQTAG
jgi:hypothetical protein